MPRKERKQNEFPSERELWSVKRAKKKPPAKKSTFWIVILLLIVAVSAAWWYVFCMNGESSPRLNYILIEMNGQPLKLLNGDALNLHPEESIKILKISTNVCFNRGIRLATVGLDVNALRYQTMTLASLLPAGDIFRQYSFRVHVKKYNEDIGYLDILVEPRIEDWIEKADRTIDKERRIEILEQALKFAPGNPQITDRLIEEYKSQKKWQQVALLLEKILEEKPDPKRLYELLEAYEALSDTDGVISVLTRLTEMDPENLDVRMQLASTLEKAGRLKEAISVYEDVLKKMPSEERLPVYKTLGYLYTKTGQDQKAVASYLEALKMDTNDVNLYYNLSFLYEKMGQKDKADFYLSKAVGLKSEDVDSRLKLAQNLIEKGNLEEAEKYLLEALKMRPNSIEALLLMIHIMEKQRDKEKLKRYYLRLLTLEPNNETIVYNLGVLEYETGNLRNSLSYFERWIKSHPKDAQVHEFLFDIYKRQKKDDLAAIEAQTLITLRPKELSYYDYIFDYLNTRGDYKKIIAIMDQGLKHHPANLDLRKYLILAYLKTGEDARAVEQMKKILEKQPKDVTLLFQLAKVQEKEGDFAEALQTYDRILKISPGQKEAKEAYVGLLLRQAKLEENQNKYQEALETYKKILDISPGQEEAAEAYLRLRLKVLPHGSQEP